MKLDSRIILQTDILTCFDIERAEQFVGQKGFFSNDLRCFENLQSCKYGTLTAILCDKTEEGYAYLQDSNRYQDFFLPESSLRESSLKPKEKKYRPYTLAEFGEKFTVGRPIEFRKKGNVENERYLILNGYSHRQIDGERITYIYIGSNLYTLDELFEKYEWRSYNTEDFEPFGVEE